jgi:hypothetical protein
VGNRPALVVRPSGLEPVTPRAPRTLRRLGAGAATAVLVDLITGFVAFCVIVLSTFWFFAFSWLQLAGEYAAQGSQWGTPGQADAAAGILLAVPSAIALVLYLGVHAYGLPRATWHLSDSSLSVAKLRVLELGRHSAVPRR